jgi:L-amino acid N-acyltransferase YncA
MEIQLMVMVDTDFDLVKEIYDFYVLNSTATYHTEKITIPELKEYILIGHPRYKSFLIKYNNNICGFCYISRFKERQAYDRTAEVTIYLKPEFTGLKIGTWVLDELETISKKAGICVLVGIIGGENGHSIRLFEKCGFEKCAHFKKVGEKFNRILDMVGYQKILDQGNCR